MTAYLRTLETLFDQQSGEVYAACLSRNTRPLSELRDRAATALRYALNVDLMADRAKTIAEQKATALGRTLPWAARFTEARLYKQVTQGLAERRSVVARERSGGVPVRMIERTGPTDAPRAMIYGVRDGFWDGAERRFGGFLIGTERHATAVYSTTETTFEEGTGERRALRGSWRLVRTLDAAGNILIANRHERDTVALPGFGTDVRLRKAIELSETQEHYEGRPAPVLTRTEFTNDAEGRVVDERQFGRKDVTGDEMTTFRTDASDDATWVRDRVVLEGTKVPDGTVLRARRHIYGDSATELPLGAVGAG
jgi:hypothetical protein